jgi:hypothetical protein
MALQLTNFMADGLEIVASVEQCTVASTWTGPVGGAKGGHHARLGYGDYVNAARLLRVSPAAKDDRGSAW